MQRTRNGFVDVLTAEVVKTPIILDSGEAIQVHIVS